MKNDRDIISVAIQGVRGSFHEIAAIEYFRGREISVVPCDTFAELFSMLTVSKADCGLVAFENSVAGSILPNYELLRSSHLPVTGEICLRVIQNLVALPGQQLSDITEIHSHPMAIQQCSVFIEEMRQKGVKIVEAVDTALSARIISEEKHYGSGAIASDSAAEMYSLSVLKREIEDDSLNYTRFLIISGRDRVDENNETVSVADKAMVCFSLPHKIGSLSQVLSVLAFYQISLTRIQSMPIVGRPWEYMFHIDLIFNDYTRYRMALDAIRPLTERLETVGEFRRGLMPYEAGNN